MNTAANCAKLDNIWAQAFAHAGLPHSLIEDEYIRDAVLQTSLIPAPYTLTSRNTLTYKLLPAVDAELSESLRSALAKAFGRTLMFDGWEEQINFILSSPLRDEFLGDVDMSGKDKTGPAIAALAVEHLKLAQRRYGYSKEQLRPTTIGVVTDNPTTM